MMMIDNKYNISDIAYLRTDDEQLERLVCAIQINPAGLMYNLSQGVESSWHYDFEITTEKSFIKQNEETHET